MFNSSSNIPSMEQRKSQISLLQAIEDERRESKEFLFAEDNFLNHRRRPSDHNVTHSASETDDFGNSFEVILKIYFHTLM